MVYKKNPKIFSLNHTYLDKMMQSNIDKNIALIKKSIINV